MDETSFLMDTTNPDSQKQREDEYRERKEEKVNNPPEEPKQQEKRKEAGGESREKGTEENVEENSSQLFSSFLALDILFSLSLFSFSIPWFISLALSL